MGFLSKQQRQRSLPVLISRGLIAVCVTLSFLATVVPAGFSSSPQTMMDCCVGKTGHVPGSCATGLFASAKKSQSASSVSSDLDSASTSDFSLGVVAGAGAGEHCHAPSARAPTSTHTVFAGPETMLTTAELESGTLTVEAALSHIQVRDGSVTD